MATKKKKGNAAAPAQGLLELSLAIASVSNKVQVDTTTSPFRTKPANLVKLKLNSAAVGISTPAAVRQLKANLSRMLPAAAADIAQVPESPDQPIADLLKYVVAHPEPNAAATPLEPWPKPSTLTVMTRSAETLLRDKVKDTYGKAFADKCSDEVAKALGAAPARTRGFQAEGVAGADLTAAPRAIVLEFAALDGVKALAESMPSAEGMTRSGYQMLRSGARQQRISSLRDGALKHVADVCGHLEQKARRTFGAMREGLGTPSSGVSVVETCWLNHTVRSRVPATMLAEVASDNKVERIDMPRLLVRELNISAVTVGSPAFRTKFNHSGDGVVVAVIDSEVDTKHPALAGRVIQAKDFTVEGFGKPDLHGTGVAGIIGGRDKKFGGIAPDVVIRNYKVLATDPAHDTDDFGATLALQTALEDGAQVANCSWGVGPVTGVKSREAKACDAAWANGLVVVKSAGNAGPDPGTITSPADADGIIVVGATDRKGKRVPDYSSRGATTGTLQRPHLLAPGGTTEDGIRTCVPGGGFDGHAGTSFAAPHVTGLVALLLDREPDAAPDRIRELLIGQCKAFKGNQANTHGAGLVCLSLV